ncbi:hypothetical protein PCC7424_4328 [Gloeothece citriformis PCC 7424]|uniref:Uncharacterized protein n=1 Tax=Gloeothece citriformis (strain PCC 7424) TaxID=65393 RepID=B7K6Z6_GLOC7|nr:hypothetical protein [Gloeothece citriformis]ACK72695.1 hypothetical protein PCC7424_4328 [Gloeothece citriformis PCC 7424]
MAINPYFNQSIGTQRLNILTQDTLDILRAYLKKDSSWNRCYRLKQQFTSRFGYCYQKDFYDLCEAAGFSVKIDEEGDHLVKAQWKRSFLKEFPKSDNSNPPYASQEYRLACPSEYRP